MARPTIVMAPVKKKSRSSRLSKPVMTRPRASRPNRAPSPSFGMPVVPASLPRDEPLAPPLSVDVPQAAPGGDLSDIRAQLEALHGVVARLSSAGTLSADPVLSIGSGLPALADSHLAMSMPPATSTRLGLVAKTTEAIKRGEFVEFDMFWCAFTLAFFGFFRVGELTSAPNTSPPPRLGDISLRVDYLVLRLRSSKADPFHHGCDVVVGQGRLCTRCCCCVPSYPL